MILKGLVRHVENKVVLNSLPQNDDDNGEEEFR